MSRTSPSTASAKREGPERALGVALAAATRWLLKQQHHEGYWWAPMDSNVCMEAEYIMLMRFLGRSDAGLQARMARHIRQGQRSDGSWATYHGGPGDLNCTVEAYFALKLSGTSPDDPQMRRARAFILGNGGIDSARVFTRLWLALFGQYPWSSLPAMPPELTLLPSWFPLNIYEFASWARQTIVPILIVRTFEPVCDLSDGEGVEELYQPARAKRGSRYQRDGLLSWRNFFVVLDRWLLFYEKRGPKPLRAAALRSCERYIDQRQESDGSWGAIQPPWFYSLLALSLLGHGNGDPAIERGIAGLRGFLVEEGEATWMQACISPIWDTALAMIGLLDSGMAPDDPAIVRGASYLAGRQIRHGGDWQVKVPDGEPGGWAFEFHNNWYPDTDDTAIVLMALQRARPASPADDWDEVIGRGERWLLAMQSRNGGWGAFDKDNQRRLVTRIPFGDFGALTDPASEDVTAHVVEYLARRGYTRRFAPLTRAIDYLRERQKTDGSWFGRWGVNYVYGTSSVLLALAAAGEDMSLGYIRRALDWLGACQNDDGGWGETCASYEDPALKGTGQSTASQTAWAMMALLSADESSGRVEAGAQFLIRTQTGEGTWNEDSYTGTGFPGDFYLNYRLYRHYWPMMALGRLRRKAQLT